jgi:predicted Ser/Thr protein kinase
MEDENLKVVKAISSGSFGKVYRAWSKSLGEMVAVKVERRNVSCSVIGYEARLLKTFSGNVGFPQFHSYHKRNGKKYIIMECLGPSIDWLHFKSIKFSVKTTVLIGE